MQQSKFPTLAQIETLIAYLPRLYAERFEPIESWDAGEKQPDGSFTMPYPKYNPLVEEFFTTISREGWLDHEYDPTQALQMLLDEHLIKHASLIHL